MSFHDNISRASHFLLQPNTYLQIASNASNLSAAHLFILQVHLIIRPLGSTLLPFKTTLQKHRDETSGKPALSHSGADQQNVSLLSLLFLCLSWIEADVVFSLLTSDRYCFCDDITMSSPPEFRRPHDPATSERQQRSALAIFGIDESAFETQSDAGSPRGK